jgi:hypothetical protein
MELVPVSATKFGIKIMDDFSIEFKMDDKGEVESLSLVSPYQELKAIRKK